MHKVIFIDRDGTIIVEPPQTKQVNSLAELQFLPRSISSLSRLAAQGYLLVVVSNQDGLGTPANPKENYDLINDKIIQILATEGVNISHILTCPHYATDNCQCRKPQIGLLTKFLLDHPLDKNNSFMIGDRDSDMQFAANLGIVGFQIGAKYTWPQIVAAIVDRPRQVRVQRTTTETNIKIDLNLDGQGNYQIDTGLKFLDHMLAQFAKHGQFDLQLQCKGDLEIDAHHSVEDIAITLGQALAKAMGDKRGIERFASHLVIVMDDAKTDMALDLSGRSVLLFEASFPEQYAGDLPTDLLEHFFHSLCLNAKINMHLKISGQNTHHKIESSFKALGLCLKDALKVSGHDLKTTKGSW